MNKRSILLWLPLFASTAFQSCREYPILCCQDPDNRPPFQSMPVGVRLSHVRLLVSTGRWQKLLFQKISEDGFRIREQIWDSAKGWIEGRGMITNRVAGVEAKFDGPNASEWLRVWNLEGGDFQEEWSPDSLVRFERLGDRYVLWTWSTRLESLGGEGSAGIAGRWRFGAHRPGEDSTWTFSGNDSSCALEGLFHSYHRGRWSLSPRPSRMDRMDSVILSGITDSKLIQLRMVLDQGQDPGIRDSLRTAHLRYTSTGSLFVEVLGPDAQFLFKPELDSTAVPTAW